MSDNILGKKGPNFALDSSFVMCSCAKEVPNKANKLATENFECYRLLRATDENNGVFGNDSPILKDNDCVPYVNMDPFQCCQADHYVETLQALEVNAIQRQNQYSENSAQYQNLQSRYQLYKDYSADAINQGHQNVSDKTLRNYTCVLELLDSWFNVDDKTLISNKMMQICKMKSKQADVARELNKKVSDIWKKLNQVLNNTEDWPYFENSVDIQDQKVSGDFAKEFEKNRKKAEQKSRLKTDINTISEIKNVIQVYIGKIQKWAGSATPAYKAQVDERHKASMTAIGSDLLDNYYLDDIDMIISETTQIQQDTETAVNKIKSYQNLADQYGIGGEVSKLFLCLMEAKGDITQLLSEIQNLKSDIYERPALTEDSFLVCRCGGIIRIVQNGDWQITNIKRLKINIMGVLYHIETKLYGMLNPNLPTINQFSIIKAFNMVHAMLLNIGEGVGSNYEYIHNEECEKSGKPGTTMEIIIRPAEEVLKQARLQRALMNVGSLLGGKATFFGVGFSILLSIDTFKDENSTILEKGEAAYGEGEPIVKKLITSGKLSVLNPVMKRTGNILKAKTIVSVIEDLLYNSYANFVGRITIRTCSFLEKFECSCNYNIEGYRESEYSFTQCMLPTPVTGSDYVKKNNACIDYKIYEEGQYVSGKDDLM